MPVIACLCFFVIMTSYSLSNIMLVYCYSHFVSYRCVCCSLLINSIQVCCFLSVKCMVFIRLSLHVRVPLDTLVALWVICPHNRSTCHFCSRHLHGKPAAKSLILYWYQWYDKARRWEQQVWIVTHQEQCLESYYQENVGLWLKRLYLQCLFKSTCRQEAHSFSFSLNPHSVCY